MKRLDELKEGKFTIVTDHGNIQSYYKIGLPIFCIVPNRHKILGFIQDSNEFMQDLMQEMQEAY